MSTIDSIHKEESKNIDVNMKKIKEDINRWVETNYDPINPNCNIL